MTHIKRELKGCENLATLEKLIDGMKPTVGKLGGRRIKVADKSGTVSITDIVECFKQLSQGAKGSDLSRIAGKIKDLDAEATEKLKERKPKIDLTKIKRFFGGKVDRNFLDAAQGNKRLALAHEAKTIYDNMSPKIKKQIEVFFPAVKAAIDKFINASNDEDARATFSKIKLEMISVNTDLLILDLKNPKRNCINTINDFIKKIDARAAEYDRILPRE